MNEQQQQFLKLLQQDWLPNTGGNILMLLKVGMRHENKHTPFTPALVQELFDQEVYDDEKGELTFMPVENIEQRYTDERGASLLSHYDLPSIDELRQDESINHWMKEGDRYAQKMNHTFNEALLRGTRTTIEVLHLFNEAYNEAHAGIRALESENPEGLHAETRRGFDKR